MVWGAGASSMPLASLPWVATCLQRLEPAPWRKQCQLLPQALSRQEEKDGLCFHGSVAPALGWVLPVCPHPPALPGVLYVQVHPVQHHHRAPLTIRVASGQESSPSSQALSAAPPVPVTNISVNKEVCLFRVIFSSLLPNDHRIKAALLDQNRSLRHSGTQ